MSPVPDQIPDQIQKQTVLKADRARVWRAISDSEAFGTWFGAKVFGPFVAGQTVDAEIRPTQVDADIAKAQEKFAGVRFPLMVETVEPPARLSFRWTPGAEPPGPDSPTTLVVFELEEAGAGQTRLTITESGFAALPLEMRAKAFADNEGGWQAQIGLVTKYLAQRAA